MKYFSNRLYQELVNEYLRLTALYREKINKPITQWNRQQNEELSRTIEAVMMQIENIRNSSPAPALMPGNEQPVY